MQLYHVSESCGFHKNKIVSIQPIGWAKKSLKYAVLLFTCRDFSPNLTSLTRLSQNRLDTCMALLG